METNTGNKIVFEDGSKYFRDSFKGFNKGDVIAFVTKMVKEHSESDEKHKKSLSESKAKLAKKEEELKDALKTIDSLKADIQTKTNEIASIQKRYAVLSEEYKRQRTLIETLPAAAADNAKVEEKLNLQIAELIGKVKEYESDKAFLLDIIKKFELETGMRTSDICGAESLKNKKISFENNMMDMSEASRKIAALEEEISAVKKENEELLEIRNKTNELSADEQKIYETITSELGNVIYSAKKTSETIVEKAKEEAEDIMNKANAKRLIFFEEYEKDVAKLKEKYKSMHEIYGNIIERFRNSYDSLSTELVNIEQIIDEVYNKI